MVLRMNTSEFPVLPDIPLAEEYAEEGQAIFALWFFVLSLTFLFCFGGGYKLYLSKKKLTVQQQQQQQQRPPQCSCHQEMLTV